MKGVRAASAATLQSFSVNESLRKRNQHHVQMCSVIYPHSDYNFHHMGAYTIPIRLAITVLYIYITIVVLMIVVIAIIMITMF